MKEAKQKKQKQQSHSTKSRMTFRLDPDLAEVVIEKAKQMRVSESWLIKDCLYKILVDGSQTILGGQTYTRST